MSTVHLILKNIWNEIFVEMVPSLNTNLFTLMRPLSFIILIFFFYLTQNTFTMAIGLQIYIKIFGEHREIIDFAKMVSHHWWRIAWQPIPSLKTNQFTRIENATTSCGFDRCHCNCTMLILLQFILHINKTTQRS